MRSKPKKVDGVLAIEPDVFLERAIANRLNRLSRFFSTNQTDYLRLRVRPISVNIEVQRTIEDWEEASAQHSM